VEEWCASPRPVESLACGNGAQAAITQNG